MKKISNLILGAYVWYEIKIYDAWETIEEQTFYTKFYIKFKMHKMKAKLKGKK